MEIKLNIAKKHLYILMAFVLAVVGLGIVIAFNTESPETFGHSAGEMMVTIDGAQKTLQSAIDDGSLGATTGGGGFQNLQVFDSSGSFTIPSGITEIMVEVWGGGGPGGEGTHISSAPGGGGGGYGKEIFTVTPGTAYTVTVGAGGVFACSGYNTLSGGTSSFGNLISATGGTLLCRSIYGTSPGNGGTSSAKINVAGGTGSGSVDDAYPGSGGSAGLGGSGGTVNYPNGVAPGGGGGPGGSGASGRVIVYW